HRPDDLVDAHRGGGVFGRGDGEDRLGHGGGEPAHAEAERAEGPSIFRIVTHSVVCVVSPSGWPCGTSLQATVPLSMIAVCGSTGPDTEPEPPQTAIMETVGGYLPSTRPLTPEGFTTRTARVRVPKERMPVSKKRRSLTPEYKREVASEPAT